MGRKNIAVFTAIPESVHPRSVISGIAAQCRKYDYNVFVFASMMHLESYWKEFLKGEKKIYGVPQPDALDGIILDMANLIEGKEHGFIMEVKDMLRIRPEIPVVTLELQEGNYPVVTDRNEGVLREMARHVIEKHGKKRICILNGPRDYTISETRMAVLLDEIRRHGLEVAEEHIIYDDFWYTGGNRLAEDLLSGKRSVPEAVLCTCDYSALGLMDRLAGSSIRIPEDMLVVGFDTTDEGQCHDISLSSYETADAAMAADAVDLLRKMLDPDKEVLPYEYDIADLFHPGPSCGCEPDYNSIMNALRNVTFFTSQNTTADSHSISADFGMLMESYCMEAFAAAKNPGDCIQSIGERAYLLHPFEEFQLCMSENWLDGSTEAKARYPVYMNRLLMVREQKDGNLYMDTKPLRFDSLKMLPEMEDGPEPSIWYFSSIHFKGDFMGYSVIRRKMSGRFLLDQVYRTWLRFINNALEMVRDKHQLLMLSVRDGMTGLYNRRGMEKHLAEMLEKANAGECLFVAVIDMDGLKMINDTYGHGEGDIGIRMVSAAVAQVTHEKEICVRAGGDEFYILGVGVYADDEPDRRSQDMQDVLSRISAGYQKPYTVGASIGCVLTEVSAETNVDAVISLADEKMYKNKCSKKMQR